MSLAIVKKVRAKYPTPLGAQHAAFLIEVAQALKMGLLKKTSGTRIRLPQPYSVEVAQDIACQRNGAEVLHYDILKDGEGEATPTWRLVGPIDPARYVEIAGSTPTPEPPAPDPEPDIRDLIAGLRLELAGQYASILDGLARLEADNRKPRTVEGSAGWIGRIEGTISGVDG